MLYNLCNLFLFSHLLIKITQYSSLISNTSIIHIMDPNINLDTLLDQMIDEELEDNTKEEVIRLILETHKQVEVTCRHKLRRKVVVRIMRNYMINCSMTISLKILYTQILSSKEGFKCQGMCSLSCRGPQQS